MLQWVEGKRVISVCAVGTGHHYRDTQDASFEMEDSITTMCRLSSGGLAQIRLDMLSDRPHNMVHYALQGTDGCYESTDGYKGIAKIWLKSRHKPNEWQPLEDLEQYLPDHWKNPPRQALEAGHGGSDYWVIQDFLSAIREDRNPPIDIDRAMDMTLPGLISQQSLAQGSTWVAVPDSRIWT